MLPDISEPFLDIFTVGEYKLCCFTSYLILGKPTNENHHLKFLSNSYLKINEHQYLSYFKFFSKVLQFKEILTADEKNKETFIVNKTSSLDFNCVTYIFTEIENELPTIQIIYKYETKISFQFDFEEFYRFFVGFRNLCFKIYCYPLHIEECIFTMLKNEPFEYIEEICTRKTVDLRILSCSKVLTPNDYSYIITILNRHQSLLCAIKWSMNHCFDELLD